MLESIGADERSRTSDLLITNQLLYQLSYISEVGHYSKKGGERARWRERSTVVCCASMDTLCCDGVAKATLDEERDHCKGQQHQGQAEYPAVLPPGFAAQFLGFFMPVPA